MDTYEVVSLEEYRRLSAIYGTAIPSNAISSIKCDERNNPVRVKYRVVALANHERQD